MNFLKYVEYAMDEAQPIVQLALVAAVETWADTERQEIQKRIRRRHRMIEARKEEI